MTKMTRNGFWFYAGCYRELGYAESAAYAHAVKPMMIVLGDDERLWVVTPTTAAKLERMGYEIL